MSGIDISNYSAVLQQLKEKIKDARIRAVLSVNKELLQTYWEIGNTILEQQKQEGWGTKVIERLAKDLKLEFPDFQGLSIRNFKYMRAFAEAYPQFPIVQAPLAQLGEGNENGSTSSIVQAPLAQLTWYHHITLLDKIKEPIIRHFYIFKTIENGWSRNVLVHQIESGLHNRQGTLITNFNTSVCPKHSELLQNLFKDPYHLDFLQMSEKARERDLENALIKHIKNFLLELGDGFAFMGQQYKMRVGEKEFIVDMLFYHTKLRRHIIIELKIGDFEPEFIGKMNLYLGIADDTLKGTHDENSIGLILCKTKDKVIAEYALRDTNKPIGISEYKITQALPDNIKGDLPSIEELEQKMDEEFQYDISDVSSVNFQLNEIKEKLKYIKTDNVHIPINFSILFNLYQKDLKPLYLFLIKKCTEFNEFFNSYSYVWKYERNSIDSIEKLDDLFGVDQSQKIKKIIFTYSLNAFIEANSDLYNASLSLVLDINLYWYSISVLGPFMYDAFKIKKTYSENLTEEEKGSIIESALGLLFGQLRAMVRHIEKIKNPEIDRSEFNFG